MNSISEEQERMRRVWRQRQACALVQRLKGEKITIQTMLRFEAILSKVEQAKAALKLYAPDDDATPVLSFMVKAIEKTLDESYCAVLRNFLFQVPKKQDRAYKEIEDRLDVLVWVVSQLKTF